MVDSQDLYDLPIQNWKPRPMWLHHATPTLLVLIHGHIFHIGILSAIFDHTHLDTPIHSWVVLVRHTAAPIIPSHSSRGKSARERLWPHRVWPSHSYSSKPLASQPWVFHKPGMADVLEHPKVVTSPKSETKSILGCHSHRTGRYPGIEDFVPQGRLRFHGGATAPTNTPSQNEISYIFIYGIINDNPSH